MRLFIEPNEPLLFRTGRPFDAGENNFAESLFPPTPETLQGAVRATIATYWHPHKNIAAAFDDPDLTNLIGDRKGYGRFRLTGTALGRYDKNNSGVVERLFPPPAHLMKDDKGVLLLTPHSVGENTHSNLPEGVSYYLSPERETEGKLKPVEGWLIETSLHNVLRGNLTGLQTVSRGDIYESESRLGIGIQPGTKATQEGFLYQTQMIRMNHKLKHADTYGFVVDIDLAPLPHDKEPMDDKQIQEALNLPDSGWMTLGGEQRAAHFRVLPSTSKQGKGQPGKRTLLYLATPASFDTGWKPSPRFAPLDKPITAAINRYEPIGGWKLNPGDAKGENKVMHRCVPAGSVYFFNRAVTPQQLLTDYGMEIGYGIVYEGEW